MNRLDDAPRMADLSLVVGLKTPSLREPRPMKPLPGIATSKGQDHGTTTCSFNAIRLLQTAPVILLAIWVLAAVIRSL